MNPFQPIIDWLIWLPGAVNEFLAVIVAAFHSIFGI